MPLVPVEYDPFMAEGAAAAVNERSALDAVPSPPSFGLADTWPAQLGRAALGAVTLPHDVMTGQVDPLSDEGIARATNLAGLDVGSLADAAGTVGRRLIPVDHDPFALASRNARMYNPPVQERPFAADYQGPEGSYGQPGDTLARDVDGNPLGRSRWLVGRKMVGGEDEAFPPAELDPLATTLTGSPSEVAPLRGALGLYSKRYLTPSEVEDLPWIERQGYGPWFNRRITLKSGRDPEIKAKALAHELGHTIDDLSGPSTVYLSPGKGARPVPFGTIPITPEMRPELERVYGDLNPSQEPGRAAQPQDFGYRTPDDINGEYLAEGIRAYMANPSYLKTVAPNTAAAIRAAVNSHPQLSKIIQFNAAASAGMALPAAASAAGVTLAPVDHDPFADLATDPNGT